ncbi:Aste57867_1673 [Aphanomyces stellatus]|uniref:Aste57867_1673 protein n=1 Tax=Aphanomyces stellatus TaxID=120398 RepID=A0A485KB72_9STRA|nr:hypothetical protein As57867_001671 [Aphanomyces stellatus]VFT78884.1 Aste57867_1673 [Aphanomyces stellatus]
MPASIAMNDTLHLVQFPGTSEDLGPPPNLLPHDASPSTLDPFDIPSSSPRPVLKSHMPQTGRPRHPVWKYFVRGEKQNRFHYRAYCRFCVEDDTAAKGTTPADDAGDAAGTSDPLSKIPPTRGVSGDMLKHLEQCHLCPASVLEELRAHTKRVEEQLPHKQRSIQAQQESTRQTLIQLWKATVSAGLDMSWTQDPRVTETLKLLPLTPTDMEAAARELAQTQLEKVKEGMLNSTIKGGLTLSINSWTTRSRQHLLAFSLMNSDGDACAISVVETALTSDAIKVHIRKVLQTLQDDNVCIVGIVADSLLAWAAASHVQTSAFPELLVVPCISMLLTTLMAMLLTSKDSIATIGTAIDLCAWCRNPAIQAVLPPGHMPQMPNRRDAISYVHCLASCLSLEPSMSLIEPHLPHPLDASFWSQVHALHTSLQPVAEAHRLLHHPTGSRTLSHVMYALGRVHQAYADHTELSPLLDRMWRLYEMPAIVLAYRFDFHFDPSWVAADAATIAAYFSTYSSRWFGTTTLSRVQDILHAVETKAFPFDCTRDYHDVSSFYSFVANSYPELCALCCRLYAISIFAAPVASVVRGIGYVASHAATRHNAKAVLPLLHIGFTTKAKSTETATLPPDVHRWLHAHDNQAHMLFTAAEWKVLAVQWKAYVHAELDAMPPSPQVPPDADSSADSTGNSPLLQLFATALPHVTLDDA